MKKWIWITLGTVATLFIVYVIATVYINDRIETFIENDFIDQNISVEDVNTNLWSGTVQLNDVRAGDLEKTQLEKFTLEGFHYTDFLFHDEIIIENIAFKNFNLELPLSLQSADSTSSKSYDIKINNIEFENGHMKVEKNDTLQCAIKHINGGFSDVNLTSQDLKTSLKYQIDTLSAYDLSLKLNGSHDLYVKSLRVDKHTAIADSVQINTNESMTSKIQNNELNKDLLSLTTTSIEVVNFELNLFSESLFNAQLVDIEDAILNIDANNNLEENKKRLTYSKQLKRLPIQLAIDTINVNNALIRYSEPHSKNTQRGAITFDDINADITNFNNIKDRGSIKMKTVSKFMGSSRLETDFAMDVHDASSKFSWSGNMSQFELERLNSFMDPVMDMKLEGIVNRYFFNVNGNEINYNAELRLKYDKVKIQFYNEEKKRKFFKSILANLLGNNSSNGKYVTQKTILKSDPRKTFFNQLWLVQREGLIKVAK